MTKRIALLVTAGCLAGTTAAQAVTVTVNAGALQQTIRGFGANASHWDSRVLSTLNSTSFRDMIATDLCISVVRFPLNPAFQPAENLDTNTLDLSQFSFSQLAQDSSFGRAMYQRNPAEVKLITSVWSPPAWMKDNANVNNGGHLRADRRPHYAKYLTAAALGMLSNYGVPLYAISLQNEPLFVEPYESCVYRLTGTDWWGGYTEDEYYEMFKYIPWALQRWGATATFFGPETMGMWPDQNMDYVRPILNDAQTAPYLQAVASHGYGADGLTPGGVDLANAEALWNAIAPYGRESWMTETSGEAPVWSGGNGNGALGLAWRIHVGLVHGNQAAFVYWMLVDGSASDYSLCSLSTPTPKYYALKHFCRWIRPGARRVSATPTTSALGVGAFLHPTNETITITIVNVTNLTTRVDLTLNNLPWPVNAFQVYRSSTGENCAWRGSVAVQGSALTVTSTPNSVLTLYGLSAGQDTPPVIAPNALVLPTNGTALATGRAMTITWDTNLIYDAQDPALTLSMLSVVDVATLQTVSVVASNVAVASHTLQWTPPPALTSVAACAVRLETRDSGGNTSARIFTNNAFRIFVDAPPWIGADALLTPSNGAAVLAGEAGRVTWQPARIGDAHDGTALRLQKIAVYDMAQQRERVVLATDVPNTNGSVAWTPAAEFSALGACAVRIIARDSNGSTTSQLFTSNVFFVVPEPMLLPAGLLLLAGARRFTRGVMAGPAAPCRTACRSIINS